MNSRPEAVPLRPLPDPVRRMVQPKCRGREAAPTGHWNPRPGCQKSAESAVLCYKKKQGPLAPSQHPYLSSFTKYINILVHRKNTEMIRVRNRHLRAL